MTRRFPLLVALLFAVPATAPVRAETATTPPDYLCKSQPAIAAASAESSATPPDYLCKPQPTTAPASADGERNKTETTPQPPHPQAEATPYRFSFSKTGVAGNNLILGHVAQVNPDCTPTGKTFVRVSVPPRHGVLTMHEGFGFTIFKDYPQCNSHKVEGTTISYLPEPGYAGSDEVEFNEITQTGLEVFATYNITIKK